MMLAKLFSALLLLACAQSSVRAQSDELEMLKETVEQLGRQTILAQLNAEERIRSSGDSGIKQVSDVVT